MTDEETRLMLRVAGGDAAAFPPLVERVLPRLLAYFRRLGATADEAEDAAQETLLKVYRARERYRPRARFLTYLFHVARNHWIDVVRHEQCGPSTFSADVPAGGEEGGGTLAAALPAAPSGPDRAVTDRELAAAVETALSALGPEHREVFLLAQVEGLKYQDISAILGIPVGTVKSRMHAAVGLLRTSLRRAGFEP